MCASFYQFDTLGFSPWSLGSNSTCNSKQLSLRVSARSFLKSLWIKRRGNQRCWVAKWWRKGVDLVEQDRNY